MKLELVSAFFVNHLVFLFSHIHICNIIFLIICFAIFEKRKLDLLRFLILIAFFANFFVFFIIFVYYLHHHFCIIMLYIILYYFIFIFFCSAKWPRKLCEYHWLWKLLRCSVSRRPSKYGYSSVFAWTLGLESFVF